MRHQVGRLDGQRPGRSAGKGEGAEEAVFVRDGVGTEGTHTNVFAVFNGHLATHPLGNFILPGVTRGVVKELCRKIGIAFKEQAFRGDELNRVSEIIITGSNKEITPVIRLDGRARRRDAAPPGGLLGAYPRMIIKDRATMLRDPFLF